MSGAEPEEIRAEIERTRADLADTVDALSAKLDVKARATEKAQQAKDSVARAVTKAKPYRGQLAAAGGVLILAVVLVVRRRSR